MIKAVLDTKIIVSAAIKSSGLQHRIWQAWRDGEFELLSSEEILAEVARVFDYPRVRRYIKRPRDIPEMLQAIQEEAELTPGRLLVDLITADPDDNKFLACAEEGAADFIVSGDRHLLELGQYRGSRIATAREFLEELRGLGRS